ncbi:MAG TPA: cell division protein ZapB [bacterium]|nr:cell division protein ZapB [bacterium]
MSKALLDALESRVNSAVDTIEGLRSELREMKEERRILEDKLRELLGRIDVVEHPAGNGDVAGERRAEPPVRPAASYGIAASDH